MTNKNQEYKALIDTYFDGSMSVVEKNSFLSKVENDAQLKKQFSFESELQDAISDPDYDNVNKVIHDVLNPKNINSSKSSRKSRIFKLLKYAAVVVAILVVGILINQMLPFDDSTSKLASKYFEPYPTYNTYRGDVSTEELTTLAFSNYESAKYDDASSNFEQLAAKDPSNMAFIFYEANALLAQGEYEKASPLLSKVVDSDNELLKDQARWYLSLSLLGSNNTNSAKSLLQEIESNKNSKYHKKASDLLTNI